MTKTVSKLSLGPSNSQHKTFLNNEEKIHQTLHYALRSRKINFTAREIYEAAGLSSPTFYLHCRNGNDALKRYERTLAQDFYGLVPKTAKKDSVLTIFAYYVARNKQYFIAAFDGCDYYLVGRVMKHYRDTLAGASTDVEFVIYTGEIVAILACWGKFEHFSQKSLPGYLERMKKVKI